METGSGLGGGGGPCSRRETENGSVGRDGRVIGTRAVSQQREAPCLCNLEPFHQFSLSLVLQRRYFTVICPNYLYLFLHCGKRYGNICCFSELVKDLTFDLYVYITLDCTMVTWLCRCRTVTVGIVVAMCVVAIVFTGCMELRGVYLRGPALQVSCCLHGYCGL